MTQFDVIILGGGPAGMSALLWCQSLGLRGLLLERAPEMGGQMLEMYHQIFDYAGLPGLTGIEMRDQFLLHLDHLKLSYRTGCKIDEVNLQQQRVRCDGEWMQAKAIIIATGARKRRLGIPGEDRFEIRGVSFSATRDHTLYAGKRVSVIGGGDSAVENALILSRICPEVTLIHRSENFTARKTWFNEAKATNNIRILSHLVARSIEGHDCVERLIVEDARTKERKVFQTEGVFIRIGITPNTEMFQGELDLDEAGYIKTNDRGQTSTAKIYAAGDVCRPSCLSVATAVGHAAVATKEIASLIGAFPTD